MSNGPKNMNFAPDISEFLARARADLRMGLPVVIQSGKRAILACAAETLTEDRLNALQTLPGGAVVAITLGLGLRAIMRAAGVWP